MIDPEAGSLIDEIWNEVVPDDGLPLIESSYQRAMSALPEMDREAARTHLMTIVKRERLGSSRRSSSTRNGRSWRRKWPHNERRSMTAERVNS